MDKNTLLNVGDTKRVVVGDLYEEWAAGRCEGMVYEIAMSWVTRTPWLHVALNHDETSWLRLEGMTRGARGPVLLMLENMPRAELDLHSVVWVRCRQLEASKTTVRQRLDRLVGVDLSTIEMAGWEDDGPWCMESPPTADNSWLRVMALDPIEEGRRVALQLFGQKFFRLNCAAYVWVRASADANPRKPAPPAPHWWSEICACDSPRTTHDEHSPYCLISRFRLRREPAHGWCHSTKSGWFTHPERYTLHIHAATICAALGGTGPNKDNRPLVDFFAMSFQEPPPPAPVTDPAAGYWDPGYY